MRKRFLLAAALVLGACNRVAGDELHPEGKTFTQTNIVLGHDFRGIRTETIPLEPSGLLGPVEILCAD